MTLSVYASDALAAAILAVGTDKFSEALHRWMGAACVFDNIAIIAFFQSCGPQVLMTHARDSRVFERIDSHYVKGAYMLDPFYGLHQKQAADGVHRLTEVAPDQFQRNEYFKSYYANTTLIDELAFFSRLSSSSSITVCIGRDATTGSRFSPKDYMTAQNIAPVVNALVKANWSGLTSETQSEPEDIVEHLRQRLSVDQSINLSPRQAQVALLILQGHSSISIGLTLGISPQTVKVLRKQLYRKCQISSQGELYYLVAPYLSEAG
ncbi:helix-turn-helix transcriptional regulator [Shimia marina]|uniref:Response regulator FixJ n=1 Tax=Shimia marina TaxID=321267 RepID=A0A0P1FFK9_9RHOB|nr:helix-turn-helix transcriptional regulator [Shimia marina]CUH52077.1 response regulator FixJ [Shimia marina]SFE63342.1 regulatory protein, luxR family [Shimia marina]